MTEWKSTLLTIVLASLSPLVGFAADPARNAPPDAASEPMVEELPAPTEAPKGALADLEKQMLAERPRQYFRRWEESPNGAYFSKKVFYRPDPKSPLERRQYVVFYPNSPDYLFLYDPEAKLYWGRIKLDAPAEESFEEVAPTERRALLSKIPEPAYGPAKPLPTLPGVIDGMTLLSPTDTPAMLSPDENEDADPRKQLAAKPKRVNDDRPVRTASKPPLNVIPPLPPAFHYEYRTVTERRWVPQVVYTRTFVDGVLVTVPLYTGYWQDYQVRKKIRVNNY